MTSQGSDVCCAGGSPEIAKWLSLPVTEGHKFQLPDDENERFKLLCRHLDTADVIGEVGALALFFGLSYGVVLDLAESRLGEGKRSPSYRCPDWWEKADTLREIVKLEGSYWHPFDVLHLHQISAHCVLLPDEVVQARIFPGVSTADVEHHLQIDVNEGLGKLTPAKRRILLREFLGYLEIVRHYAPQKAIAKLFSLSESGVSFARMAVSKTTQYESRFLAYRELIDRQPALLSRDTWFADILLVRVLSQSMDWPDSMIVDNFFPDLKEGRWPGLKRGPLPEMTKPSGRGEVREWIEKLPMLGLLHQFGNRHFGAVPRGELQKHFPYGGSAFSQALLQSGIDEQSWDRRWRANLSRYLFSFNEYREGRAVEALHAMMLLEEGVSPEGIVADEMPDWTVPDIKALLYGSNPILRSSLTNSEKAGRPMDSIAAIALRNYFLERRGTVLQSTICRFFGIGHFVFYKTRREMRHSGHWERLRERKLFEMSRARTSFFGEPAADAVTFLRILVEREHSADPRRLKYLQQMRLANGPVDETRLSHFSRRLKAERTDARQIGGLVYRYFERFKDRELGGLRDLTGLTSRVLGRMRDWVEKS